MRTTLLIWTLVGLGSLRWPATCGASEVLSAEHLSVSWVAPRTFGPEAETIGIAFTLDPHWHIYWKNPGDSGTAPKFQFQTGSSKIGAVQWPYPKRLPLGELVNFGYENFVVFPFQIQPDRKGVQLEVKLEWLVCQEECVPGFGTLTLKRPVRGDQSVWIPRDQHSLEIFQARVPHSAATDPWHLRATRLGSDQLQIGVTSGPVRAGSNFQNESNSATNPSPSNPHQTLDLFPTDGERVRPQMPGRAQNGKERTFVFQLQPNQQATTQTGFVLTDGEHAWEFPNLPFTDDSDFSAAAILLLLVSAFVGGIILNGMPCVLPVLSIKFLSLAKAEASARKREALLYSAGVIITFLVLGGACVALRSFGLAIGWGFQLQQPAVILGLATLFWLMGLNFFGFFEFGLSLMNVAGQRSSRAGAFGTGILSVFVAAPCTGPFMGTALGAAATAPALLSLPIFVILGVGLAFPFILVAFFPRLLFILPRPGAWMETLRQLLAFPLFATVIWLLWVLNAQTGSEGWLIAGGFLLLVTFSIWTCRHFNGVAKAVFISISVGSFVLAAQRLNASLGATSTQSGWEAFNEQQIMDARAAHEPVFIDFTAAWCISCQVNQRAVLETERAQRWFKAHGVRLFIADWTRQDPAITQSLSTLGRNSVPVYAYYPSDGSAVRILPQVLTFGAIENLVDHQSKPPKAARE